MKMECDYLSGLDLKKRVTCAEISPKMVNPEIQQGKEEDDDEEDEENDVHLNQQCTEEFLS